VYDDASQRKGGGAMSGRPYCGAGLALEHACELEVILVEELPSFALPGMRVIESKHSTEIGV
jgi:hypothetical protein